MFLPEYARSMFIEEYGKTKLTRTSGKGPTFGS